VLPGHNKAGSCGMRGRVGFKGASKQAWPVEGTYHLVGSHHALGCARHEAGMECVGGNQGMQAAVRLASARAAGLPACAARLGCGRGACCSCWGV
jgi:hypothetical protein